MSIPIKICRVYKAALGNEEEYKRLLEDMIINTALGHWSQFGCKCEPPCEIPSQEKLDAFKKRINEDLGTKRKKK